jgi:FkbM family methyltransferase
VKRAVNALAKLWWRLLTGLIKRFPAMSTLLNCLPRGRENKIHLGPWTYFEKIKNKFWDAIFIAIAGYAVGNDKVMRQVKFGFRDRYFQMDLNVREGTQCGYYFSFPDLPLNDYLVGGERKKVFLDVGANVGIFSLFGSLYFDRVYSFEPNPSIFERLNANIKLSGADHVSAMPMALSGQPGEMTLHVNPTNHGGSTLNGFPENYKKALAEYEWKTYQVKVTTLDDFVKANNITEVNLIKIDVEGHEQDVLRGATSLLKNMKPILFIEITTREQFDEIRRLIPANYKACDPYTKNPIESDAGAPWRLSDVVFQPS